MEWAQKQLGKSANILKFWNWISKFHSSTPNEHDSNIFHEHVHLTYIYTTEKSLLHLTPYKTDKD